MLRYIIGISLIISTIILIRHFGDRKINKRFQYALWVLVPIYMLVFPFISFGIELPEKTPVVKEQTVVSDKGEQIIISDIDPVPLDKAATYDSITPKREIDWPSTLRNFSILISMFILICLTIYNAGFILYVRKKRVFFENDPISNLSVYIFNHAGSPFLLGNKIYIKDTEYDKDSYRYVICHEYCHYKQGDPIWLIVRYMVLATNWYNPLVWFAFFLSEQDCELACDEAVIHMIGEDKNIEYGNTLLSILTENNRQNGHLSITTSMSGRSKRFMKKRIINIKDKNEYKAISAIFVCLLMISVVGCSLIEFKETESTNNITEQTESVTEITISEKTEAINEDKETEVTVSDLSIQETENSEETTEETKYSPVIIGIPEDNCHMEDGIYTVAMTPWVSPDADGKDTVVFIPWTQFQVDQNDIDELEIGDIYKIEYIWITQDDEHKIEITNTDIINIEPEIKYGTEYTGEIIYISNEYYLSFRKTNSGSWNLFDYESPVCTYSNPVRMTISDDVIIHDAYHPVALGETADMTPDELKAVLEFTDTTLTDGRTESIHSFFDDRTATIEYTYGTFDIQQSSHNNTLIKVENDQITEVWFCY